MALNKTSSQKACVHSSQQGIMDVPMMCACTPLQMVLNTKILTCLEPLQQQPPVCKSPIRFACSGWIAALSISMLLCGMSHQHTESSSSGCVGGASRGSNAACSSGHLRRTTNKRLRHSVIANDVKLELTGQTLGNIVALKSAFIQNPGHAAQWCVSPCDFQNACPFM